MQLIAKSSAIETKFLINPGVLRVAALLANVPHEIRNLDSENNCELVEDRENFTQPCRSRIDKVKILASRHSDVCRYGSHTVESNCELDFITYRDFIEHVWIRLVSESNNFARIRRGVYK